MRGVIRELFDAHLPEILAERELGEREWRGAWCVLTCQTAEQGSHLCACPQGHGGHERFNSCRHRGCPTCGWPATQRWVEQREAQAPGCAHVHTVWTVPDTFGPLWAFNRRSFTNLMFRASWETVQTLMADERWCGARPGMISVFQSWGDFLQRHPHVHALVTAGGVDASGAWRERRLNVRPRFLRKRHRWAQIGERTVEYPTANKEYPNPTSRMSVKGSSTGAIVRATRGKIQPRV